jgi:hypothetical protein
VHAVYTIAAQAVYITRVMIIYPEFESIILVQPSTAGTKPHETIMILKDATDTGLQQSLLQREPFKPDFGLLCLQPGKNPKK